MDEIAGNWESSGAMADGEMIPTFRQTEYYSYRVTYLDLRRDQTCLIKKETLQKQVTGNILDKTTNNFGLQLRQRASCITGY